MAPYLPVLLVSVSAVSSSPAPDDSSLDTQAIGQVDYLSHDWQEEDVAKSWRNMTRRKDSIQNGARLENASWRTWWKQRNNLPTVSPETLNWLKDSDVTWLYGPLHTAADWVPPPRHSPEPDGGACSPPYLSLRSPHPPNGLRSHAARSNSPWSLKPILKHRSISELLSISLPPSPGSDPMELDEGGYFNSAPARAMHTTKTLREHVAPDEARKRPKLTHTRSDTNVHQRNPFRRESPPLPLGAERSRDSSCGDPTTAPAHRGRHISFNTFVEQCIAIEKPKKPHTLYEEDSFYEDENGYCEDEEDSEEDEDESEDDVLEMRPTPRSRSSSSRRTPSLSSTSASTWSTSGHDMSSPEREHVTIAPIAPTMLKTSASPSPPAGPWNYGSLWEEDEAEEEETLFASERTERPDSVNLVYVPPQGSVYAGRMPAHAGKLSPPHITAELRAASFDDAALLPGRRPDVTLEPPFDATFDFIGGPDGGGVAEYSPHPAARSGRSPAQSRSSSSGDLADETRSRSSQGSASEDGTVVPSAVVASPPHASPIPVPRHTHHAHVSPASTPSPVPAGAPSSSSPYLEPPAPQRGRSTSPVTGRDPEPSRGRSRSRSSVEGSVSPRSGSRLGRRASTSLGTSPTWRDKSLSPEECESSGVRRAGKHSKRRGSTGGLRDSPSMSPPSTVIEEEDPVPSPKIPTVGPQHGAGDAVNTASSTNPTPSNSPTTAFKPLVHAASEESITLAGRVVSSARGYLGSFWGGGERHPTHHQDVPVTSTVPGTR